MADRTDPKHLTAAAPSAGFRATGLATPLLLDAAMGTALIARGLDPDLEAAPAWALSRPREVVEVHRGHVAAGARLLLTDTFSGRPPSADEVAAALALAREAGAPAVALSLWAGLAPQELERAARLAARAGAPPDLVWLETATSEGQAERALAAALEAGAGPVAITLACTALQWPDWPAVLRRLAGAGAAAAGLNCSPWPAHPGGLAAVAARAAAALAGTGCALALKPDAGPLPPQAWAAEVHAAVRAGALLVGGCCGTGSAHLAALAGLLGRC